AGDGVPEGRPAGARRRGRQRRGARQVALDRGDDAGAAPELRPVPGADALQDRRPAEEVRQDVGATGKDYGKVTGDRTEQDIVKRRSDRWNFLFIAGMWFQDLFNYDFR